MRLLLIEDDVAIHQQVAKHLKQQGYAVDGAFDGEEGWFLGHENDYDIAIIDLGLPKLSGTDLIQRLRAAQHNWPILILTARGNWQDKVQGLEAGADDYLVKPFHMEELQARLKALLRRSHGHASNQLQYANLLLDLKSKAVFRDQQRLELTAYEYNTLEYLALNRNKVISKTELTEHLYDQDFDRDSNVIEVFVGRLRKKLDPDGQLQPIQTIRGQGYQFMLPLESV